jgi:hypothetical protein
MAYESEYLVEAEADTFVRDRRADVAERLYYGKILGKVFGKAP